MVALSAGSQTARLHRDKGLPPDCRCDVCQQNIDAAEPRWRCAANTCDDVHVCEACALAQPQCQTCESRQLYLERASPFVLRTRVFRESFSAADVGAVKSTDVVHPHVMVARAFHAYGGRPLLGEPGGGSRVHWWSYSQCGAAAQLLACRLWEACRREQGPSGAVVICAANSVGWLITDWACALASLPSIAIDMSTPPASALATACDAARRRGRALGAVCVDSERVSDWHSVLQCTNFHRQGDGTASEDRSCTSTVAIISTAEPREQLLACSDADAGPKLAAPTASAAAFASAPAAAPAASESDLVTCLFSFGSTGEPKPLWFDSLRWAEWGERNPPASRRARSALARRSLRVSCAALFAPLSHGLARRTAWGELLHGGRLGLCRPRGGSAGAGADDAGDLLDQIHAIAPTTLSAAPRFYTLYQRRHEAELAAAAAAAAAAAVAAAATTTTTAARATEAGALSEDAVVGKTAGEGETGANTTARAAAMTSVRQLGGSRLRLVAIGDYH